MSVLTFSKGFEKLNYGSIDKPCEISKYQGFDLTALIKSVLKNNFELFVA